MNKEEKKSALEKLNKFFKPKGVAVDIVEVTENRATKLVAFAKDKENEDSKLELFEELNIEGGEVIMIEPAVEAGAAIAAQTPEGEWVPAPAGKYELADGRIVSVIEDGLIDAVEEVEADGEVVEEVVEEDMSTENPKRVIESTVREKIFAKQEDLTKLIEEIAELQKTNKFLLESLEAKVASEVELKEEFASLKEFNRENFERLYTEPIAEPVVKMKSPLTKEVKNNYFLNRKKK